jgi:hypothetical protein
MSLLMKALEKAAKDRMDAGRASLRRGVGAGTGPGCKELTPEPIAAEVPVAPRGRAAAVVPTVAP